MITYLYVNKQTDYKRNILSDGTVVWITYTVTFSAISRSNRD